MSEQDNLQEADGKDQLQSKENNTEDNITTDENNVKPPENQTNSKTSEQIEEQADAIVNSTDLEENQTADTEIINKIEESNAEDAEDEKQAVPVVNTTDLEDNLTADTEIITKIEESNAEDAEDEGKSDRHTIETKDYDKMSLEQLANELENLVSNEKIQAIKSHVDTIKTEFNSQFNALLAEKKVEFLNEGGNEIDFYYSSPTQKRFKDSFKEYRGKINAHYKNLEKDLKENLVQRLQIIEEIKGLINVEENINTTYKHFKELQDRWKNSGPIPRDRYNNAWNSYHHHVEIFYDFLHLNRDLRDLDFKHNLEQKIKIIERAEELAQDDNLNRAFRELQVLHKMWKEELGPVDREQREPIWERFKKATKSINDKRQVYFSELDKIYDLNLVKKNEIISKIKAIGSEKGNSHSVWQNKIKEIEVLRQEFFNAGKVPIKVNEATWTKFKAAVREFNSNKNAFYKGLKKGQFENLQKKLDLIKVAEENKDNDDFDTITPLMKKIQNEWKKIGHVPRKDSDKIWNQFKSACNHYFDKLHAVKDEVDKVGFEAYTKKNSLLEEIKTMKLSGKKETDLMTIKDYISKWKAIGNVPSSKRYIEGKLNKTLDGIFKNLDLNKNEAELIKFENKLEQLSNASDSRFLDNERSFIRKKIDDVKSEINQLENNLQFFTNVKDDNPLMKEVHKNIDKHKDALQLWKTKLIKIKELY